MRPCCLKKEKAGLSSFVNFCGNMRIDTMSLSIQILETSGQ